MPVADPDELLPAVAPQRAHERRAGARVLKVVSFFLLAYRSGSVRDYQRAEVDGAEWLPLEEAPARLAYKGEKQMAKAALSKLADKG